MRAVVVLLTRDLRIRDNPALAGALAVAQTIVPLFVLDPVIADRSDNRRRFLLQSLADVRQSLRDRGGDLFVRQGDPVECAVRMARTVGAEGIAVAEDVSRYAQARERRLRAECARNRLSLTVFSGTTIVPPGAVRPGGGRPAYRVFTPYWRVWREYGWRSAVPTPARVPVPSGLAAGLLPAPLTVSASPDVAIGGEGAARRRLSAWLADLGGYADNHDLMAADRTSRLSPYLRFGCLSAVELARAALGSGDAAAEGFVRQLCWRDFYYQVAAAQPELTTTPLRAIVEDWRDDADALQAWREGQTGIPIVDAGMRQLARSGWLHNRSRLVVASFLTKHLGLDWRAGADWFARLLIDGDVPNNYGNWQWVAGTGNDTRPYRRFNPIRQAKRFDPNGDYVRRYVPELSKLNGSAVHEPWLVEPSRRRGYPEPLIHE